LLLLLLLLLLYFVQDRSDKRDFSLITTLKW
jgi:hypothetical protein